MEATDPAGAKLVATYFVTCDYLAVGRDDDFFRVPMSPRTAAAIADAARCSLITAKVSDNVFAAAPVKLEPQPLTANRDAVATFFEHHRIIEDQLRGRLRGQLVAGIKKDVVLTKRLQDKPHRVAIYGWHYPDRRPIQPLYVGHVDWYVDYSHGIRLMSDQISSRTARSQLPKCSGTPDCTSCSAAKAPSTRPHYERQPNGDRQMETWAVAAARG